MTPKARNTNRDSTPPRRERRNAANTAPAADVPAPQTDGPTTADRSTFFEKLPRPRFRSAASAEGAAVPAPESDDRVATESAARARILRSIPRPRFRVPRAAAGIDRVPVRYRVARAVGTAASAIPESRVVRVGTAVAGVVAANPGIVRAGLTAASAVPVLRPYVKVAVVATTAITAARRIAAAKRAAADVVSAFRGHPDTGMAHAGNGFRLGTASGATAGDRAIEAAPAPPANDSAEPEAPERATAPEEAAGR
jgi:hypothetical protein